MKKIIKQKGENLHILDGSVLLLYWWRANIANAEFIKPTSVIFPPTVALVPDIPWPINVSFNLSW
jgi:hypothetical protein